VGAGGDLDSGRFLGGGNAVLRNRQRGDLFAVGKWATPLDSTVSFWENSKKKMAKGGKQGKGGFKSNRANNRKEEEMSVRNDRKPTKTNLVGKEGTEEMEFKKKHEHKGFYCGPKGRCVEIPC